MLDILSPLRGYIAQSLHFYLGKYIEGIQLEGLGLFGGDLVLNDLEIKRHVLRESLEIPSSFDFSRGFIRELRIHIPWTQLLSQPIEVKLYTIELILTAKSDERPTRTASEAPPKATVNEEGEEKIEQPKSGWLHDTLQKILANISVQVNNLVLKYEHDDVVFSIALGTLDFYSANERKGWQRSFEELDGERRAICKRVDAKDLTIFLDRYTSTGVSENSLAQDPVRRKVVGYEVPVLSRTSASIRAKMLLFPNAPIGANQDGRKSRPTSPLHRPLPTPNLPHAEENIIDIDGLFSYRPSVMCDPFYYYSCNRASVVPMYEVDVFISELFFSVSDRQLEMITQLIESATRKLDQAHRWAAEGGNLTRELASSSPENAQSVEDLSRDSSKSQGKRNADQENDSSSKSQNSWFGWAMNALGTAEDEEEDELVSELLAETRGALLKAQAQTSGTEDALLVPSGPITKTICIRLCISTASLMLRKHEKEEYEVERQDSTLTESEELVPVANLGMVKIPVQAKRRKAARPAAPIFYLSLNYVALEMLLARGEEESGTDLVFEIEKVELVSASASDNRDDSKCKKGQALLTWGSVDSSHFSDCVSHPYFISSFFGEEITRLNQRESRSFEIVKVSLDADIPVWKTLEVGRGRKDSVDNELATSCGCSTTWNGEQIRCVPVTTVSRLCEHATRAIGIKERVLDEGILCNAISTAWASGGFPISISERMTRALASVANEYRAHRNPDLGAVDNLAQLLLPQLVALFCRYTLHSCSATSLHTSSESANVRNRSVHSALRLRLALTSTPDSRDDLASDNKVIHSTTSRALDISIGAANAVLEPAKCTELVDAISIILRANKSSESKENEEKHDSNLTAGAEPEQLSPRNIVLSDVKLVTVNSLRLCLPEQFDDAASACSCGDLVVLVRDVMWKGRFCPGSSNSHLRLGTTSVIVEASRSGPSSSATSLLEALEFEAQSTEKPGDGGDNDALFVNLNKLMIGLRLCTMEELARSLDRLLSPLGWPLKWRSSALKASRSLFRVEMSGAAFSRVVSHRPRFVMALSQTLDLEIESVSVTVLKPAGVCRVILQGGAIPFAARLRDVSNIPFVKIAIEQEKTAGVMRSVPLVGAIGLFSLNPSALGSTCTRCQFSLRMHCADVFADLNGAFQLISVILAIVSGVTENLRSVKKSSPSRESIDIDKKLKEVSRRTPTAWRYKVNLTTGSGTILLNDALQVSIPLISVTSTDADADWTARPSAGGKINLVFKLQDTTLNASANGVLKELKNPRILCIQGVSASASFAHSVTADRHIYSLELSFQVASIQTWFSRLKLLYLLKLPRIQTQISPRSSPTAIVQETKIAESQIISQDYWYWKLGGQLDYMGVTCSADVGYRAGQCDKPVPVVVFGEILNVGIGLRIGNHHPFKHDLKPSARGDFTDVQVSVGNVQVVEKVHAPTQKDRSRFGEFSMLPEHAFLGILVCLDLDELLCLLATFNISGGNSHEQPSLPDAMFSWHLTNVLAKAFHGQVRENADGMTPAGAEIPLLAPYNNLSLEAAARSFPLIAIFYRSYNEAGQQHYVASGSLESVDIALTPSSLYCFASVLKVRNLPASSVGKREIIRSDDSATLTEEPKQMSLAGIEVSILIGRVRVILPNETLRDSIASKLPLVKGNVCVELESLSVASAVRNDISLDGLGYPPFNSRVLPRRPTVQAHRFGQSELRVGCRAGKVVAFIADLSFDQALQHLNREHPVAGPFEQLIGDATGRRAQFSNAKTFWSPFNVTCGVEEEPIAVEGSGMSVKTSVAVSLTKWRFNLHKASFDELLARIAGVGRGVKSLGQSLRAPSSVERTPIQYTKQHNANEKPVSRKQREVKFSCDGIEVNLFGLDSSTHVRIGSIDVAHNLSSLSGSASIQNGAIGHRVGAHPDSLSHVNILSEEVIFGANADPSLWHLTVENYPEKLIAARWNFGEQAEGTVFIDVQAYQLHLSHHFMSAVSRFVKPNSQSSPAYYFDRRECPSFVNSVERQVFKFQPKWVIKVLIAPSVISYWKRDGEKSSGIWVTSGQIFASAGIGSDELAQQSVSTYGDTVNDINRFVAVPTLEMMLNADKCGVNTSREFPSLSVQLRSDAVGSVSIHASSTWQHYSKYLSTVSEAQRLLHDCSVRVTGDHHQMVERFGLGEAGVCLLYSDLHRTNIQAEVNAFSVKLSSSSLGALQALLNTRTSTSDRSREDERTPAARPDRIISAAESPGQSSEPLPDYSVDNAISTDDFKNLIRTAEGRRPSPGELVLTEALLIETQNITQREIPIPSAQLHVQVERNKHDIELADVAAFIQDVNEPWHSEASMPIQERASAPDLNNKTHSWMGMHWCYHIPRRINTITVNPVPLPPTIPAGWPSWSWNHDQEDDTARLCDIYCQLRCWDRKRSAYVVVGEFYVPWERAEVVDDIDDAYEPGSFGELMSQWFDDDMEETRFRNKLLECSSRTRVFTLTEELASENWEIRWRAPLRSEQEPENKQNRLLVNALLASSLEICSTLTSEAYQRLVTSVTLPQVALSISYVGPTDDSHDIITAELNDTSVTCAMSGSDQSRKLNVHVSSAVQVYLDNMVQLLTVSVIPRTTIDAMVELTSDGLQISTLVGPVSLYLNQTSMLVISAIPKLLQVSPRAPVLSPQSIPAGTLSNMRIKLVNAAGVDIWYRQEGTLECLKLAAATSAAYSWLSLADSPFYQLRFALSDPSVEQADTIQLSEKTQQANEESQWCDPCRIKENSVTGRFFRGLGFLWICVELSGLQTVVTLRSPLVFHNYCNFAVQMKLQDGAAGHHCKKQENFRQARGLAQNIVHSNCISIDGEACALAALGSFDESACFEMVESVSSVNVGVEGGSWCSVTIQEGLPNEFDLVKISEEQTPRSGGPRKSQRSFVELKSQNLDEPSRYAWIKFGRAQCRTILPTDFDPLQPRLSRRYTWLELSLWPAIVLENAMDIPVLLNISQKATQVSLKIPPRSDERLSTINPFDPVDIQLTCEESEAPPKPLTFSVHCTADDTKDQLFDFAGCRVVTTVASDFCPMVRIKIERVLSVVNMTPTPLHVNIGSPLGNQTVFKKIDSGVERSVSFSVVSNRLVLSVGMEDESKEDHSVKWSPEVSLVVKGDSKPIIVPSGELSTTSIARMFSIELANSDGYLKLVVRPQVVMINSTSRELKLLPTDGRGNALVDEDNSWVISGANAGWCVPVCIHKEAKKRSITADVSSWLSSRLSRRPSEDLSAVKQTLVARLSCSFRVCLAEDGYDWTEEIAVLLPNIPLQLNPDGSLKIVELPTTSTSSHEGLYPAPCTTTQRRRLLIRHRAFRHKMVTYTMTQSDRCISIMFFVDHQPPVIVYNQWQSPLGFRNVSFPSDPEGIGADCYMEYDWGLQVSAKHSDSSRYFATKASDSDDIKCFSEWLESENVRSENNDVLESMTSTERMRFQIGLPQYGWSNALWQVGGIQFASFSNRETGDVAASAPTFLVMCFYRAGSWLISVTCLEDPTRDAPSSGTPSLVLPSMTTPTKPREAAPSFLKIGVVVEELSLHFCDEHDPVRDARGFILYPEILRATCNAVSFVFSTTPDPPEVARHSTKLGYLSHIRSYTTLYLSVDDIEIDHFLQTCNFPVILCFPGKHTVKDLLQFDRDHKHERLATLLNKLLDKQLPGESDTSLIARVIYTDTWDPVGIPSYFHSIELQLAPLVLQMEDNILSYVNVFARPILDALQGESVSAAHLNGLDERRFTHEGHDNWILRAYEAAAVTKQRKVYIEYLGISNLQVTITARVTIPVLNSFDGTPLHFGATQMREVFSFPDQLYKDLAAEYVADTIVRSPMLLMSLNIIGNPAGFLRSFGQGVRDLVEIPLAASRNGYSPWVLTKGVMGGVASFLGHTTTAALTSVSGFSYSISRTMDQLTLPSEQLKKRHYTRPTQLSSALADGLGSLGSSVVGAAAGVITTPIAVYKERQMQGLDTGIRNVVGGVGMGLVGIVARPMGGVASLVSMASDGLLYGMGGGRTPFDETSSRFDARPNELLRYKLKVLPDVMGSQLIFAHGAWIVPEENHLLATGQNVEFLSQEELREQTDESMRSLLLPGDLELRITQVTVVCSNEFLYVVGVSGRQNQAVLVRTPLQAIQAVEESLKEPSVFDLGVKTSASVEWLRFRLPPRQRRQLSHQLRLWLAEDRVV